MHERAIKPPFAGWSERLRIAPRVQTAALAVLSGSAPPLSLGDLVAQIAPRDLFLIYAENGGREELNADYFRAASEPKTLWKVADAGHVGGIRAQPQQFEERVIRFFDGALLGAG